MCYEFDKETGTILWYKGKEKNTVIPSEIDGVAVKCIGERAFDHSGLESVEIPDSVTKIEKRAFRRNELTELNIPESVTEIGEEAFSGNKQLTSILIPNGVTTIGKEAFSFGELTDVIISDGVTEIGEKAFYSNNISNLVLSKNLLKVGERAFGGNELKTVTIPENVIEMGENSFYSAKLKEVIVKYNDTNKEKRFNSKWKNIGFPVELKPGAKNINGLVFDPDFGEILKYKGEEKHVIIPNEIDGVKVTSIGDRAFYSIELESVKLPDGLISIGEYAFCWNKLTSITIPENVEIIGEEAFHYNKISDLKIVNGVAKKIEKNAFSYNKLKDLVIPGSVTEIGEEAFIDNKLKSVTLFEGVKKIKKSAFEKTGLTTLTIPSSITDIGNKAFQSNQLCELIISEGVKNIGSYAFCDNKLTNVIIPSTVKKIGSSAFGYNEIKDVEIKFNEINSEDRFNGEWESIGFPSKVVSSGDYVFDSNSGTILKYNGKSGKVVIPDKLEAVEVKVIGNSSFESKGITEIVIPECVEIIESYAFLKNNVGNLEIPNGVKKIGYDAFGSNPLKMVKLPNSIETIDEKAVSENFYTILNGLITNKYELDETTIIETLAGLFIVPKIDKTVILHCLHRLNFNEDYTHLLKTKNSQKKFFANYVLRVKQAKEVVQKPIEEQLKLLNELVDKKIMKKLDLLNLDNIPTLRLKSTEEVDENIKLACITASLNMKFIAISPESELIANLFMKEDLSNLAEYFFNEWKRVEKDKKLEPMLSFIIQFANEQLLPQVTELIKSYIWSKKNIIAGELLHILAIRNVMKAAKLINYLLEDCQGLQYQLGQTLLETIKISLKINKEDLFDYMVPNLMFDENGILELVEDKESLRIGLDEACNIEYLTEDNKRVKRIPNGKGHFKSEIKDLKLLVEEIIEKQIPRLEKAHNRKRNWNIDVFTELFLNNYLIKTLSRGIVFCYEKSDGTNGTFTITKDNTLETVDYDEITLDKVDKLYLLKPTKETTELVHKWKEYITDNELKPNINQFK